MLVMYYDIPDENKIGIFFFFLIKNKNMCDTCDDMKYAFLLMID